MNQLSLPALARLVVVGVSIGAIACADASSDGSIEIAKSQYGAEWPFTVESGRLRCDPGSHVVFVSNQSVYAINGSAKGAAAKNGYRNVDAIWALQKPEPPKRVASLPLSQRQSIFAELLRCEGGSDDARVDRCKATVKKQSGISDEVESLISEEGATLSWPPLTPLRVSVGRIIADGLKLCK